MDAAQIEKTLTDLAGIERGLAKVYLFLAEQYHFSIAARKLWRTLHEEELKHEQLFLELRRIFQINPQALDIVALDHEYLQEFVGKVNALLAEVKKPDLTEAAAYSIGARIEAEFDEGKFLSKIEPHDTKLRFKIHGVINDCKRHTAMLIAYTRGAR